MPPRRFPALLAAVLGAAVCVAAFAEDLRLRFQPGDTLRYRQVNRSTAGVRRGDKSQTYSTVLTQEIVRTVVEVDREGCGACTNRFDKVACELTIAGNRLTYDSARPEDAVKVKDPNLARFAGLTGREIRMKLSPTAAVLSLEGFGRIAREIAAGLDGSDAQQARARRQIEEGYADDLMLKKSQAIAEVLPAHPVAAGGVWQRAGALPSASVGEVRLAFTYTFVGVEKIGGFDCAHIVGKADLTLPSPLPSDCRFAGGSAQLVRGDYATDVWFDLSRAIIRRATEHIEIVLTASSAEVSAQTESVTSDTELQVLGER